MQTQNTSVVPVSDEMMAAFCRVDRPNLLATREVARGKGHVLVQDFASSGPASQVRATLKLENPKLSAKKLNAMVLAVMRGEKTMREQLSVAFHQSLIQAGFVPSHGETGTKSAVIRFTLAPEPKAVEAEKPATAEDLKKQIEALSAKLAEMTAAK